MTGGGATGAVGSRGDGRRGYKVCGEVGRREKGLYGPWGGGVTGGRSAGAVGGRVTGRGATGSVGRWGDGRRAYRGRWEVG